MDTLASQKHFSLGFKFNINSRAAIFQPLRAPRSALTEIKHNTQVVPYLVLPSHITAWRLQQSPSTQVAHEQSQQQNPQIPRPDLLPKHSQVCLACVEHALPRVHQHH